MIRRIHPGLMALALPLLACRPAGDAPADRAADLEAIRQLHAEHIDAALNKDVEAFMATVTDSFVLLPPDDPGAAGAEAVRDWVGAFFENATIQELEFTSMDFVVDGDWAAAHYRYDWTVAPTGEGEPMSDVGQGVYVYRRQPDGGWLIAYDVWNSDGTGPGGGE